MIDIITTRWLHMKRQLLSILFWIVFPVLFTWILISGTELIQDQSAIPVGIILEEETEMATQLKEKLDSSDLIRVVEIENETEVRQLVATHELDSAFIIEEGYADAIQTGQRNQLVTSYRTDLSMGYTPVVEMIASFVQEDSGKSKTAYTVMDLGEALNSSSIPSFDEIINEIYSIEESENLIFTNFHLLGEDNETDTGFSLFQNPWGLWSIFTLLSTFFLFDWLIKEKNAMASIRFTFHRFSFQAYLLYNLLFYSFGLFVLDLLTWGVFYVLYDEGFYLAQFIYLVSFRLTICMLVFLIGLAFKKLLPYYITAIIICLITIIISGIILPMDGIYENYPWVAILNPLRQVVYEEVWSGWTIIAPICLIVWYVKGVFNHAAGN
ncbi:ABC transporter permease [Oceanobacillus jeddahense]|uniref:ABC transporter permease n=1 Tax=Oceanobacillus jeddahense TaxID=1462527 RepID=A0ABY5K1U6_9BACI|nr:ABC transporter permease [Oceanobacillus jeddahense]UUI05276.1 ABC transporter permease [Oceanobacillus jeddahense]